MGTRITTCEWRSSLKNSVATQYLMKKVVNVKVRKTQEKVGARVNPVRDQNKVEAAVRVAGVAVALAAAAVVVVVAAVEVAPVAEVLIVIRVENVKEAKKGKRTRKKRSGFLKKIV